MWRRRDADVEDALVVRRQHDGALGAHGEVLELVDHQPAGDAVERRCRLVGDDEIGQSDHDAGDGDALLLAARQLVGPGGGLVAKPSRLSRWRARGSSQAGSDSGVVETPAMTFCNAVSEESRLRFWNRNRTRLRKQSSSRPPRPDDVGAQQAKLALGRPTHGAEDGEQSGLSRTDGPVTITSSPSRTCMLMSNSTSARCGPSP
jgi:hypothetical protein